MSETPKSADVQSKEKSLADLMERILAKPLAPLEKSLASLHTELEPANAKLHKSLSDIQQLLLVLNETVPQQSKRLHTAVDDLDVVLETLQKEKLPSLQVSMQEHVRKTAEELQQKITNLLAKLGDATNATMAEHTDTLQAMLEEQAVVWSKHYDEGVAQSQAQHLHLQQSMADGTQALQAWMEAQCVRSTVAVQSALTSVQQTILAAVQAVAADQQACAQVLTQHHTEQLAQAVIELQQHLGQQLERRTQQHTRSVSEAMEQQTAMSTAQSDKVQAALAAAHQTALQQHQLQARELAAALQAQHLQHAKEMKLLVEQLQAMRRQQKSLQRGLWVCGVLGISIGTGAWWPTVRTLLGM